MITNHSQTANDSSGQAKGGVGRGGAAIGGLLRCRTDEIKNRRDRKRFQAATGSRRSSVTAQRASSRDSRTTVFAHGRHLPQQLPTLSWLRTSWSDSAPEATACRIALSDTLWQMQTIMSGLDPNRLVAGLTCCFFVNANSSYLDYWRFSETWQVVLGKLSDSPEKSRGSCSHGGYLRGASAGNAQLIAEALEVIIPPPRQIAPSYKTAL